MYSRIPPSLALFLAISAFACSPEDVGQMSGTQNFAVFRQSPSQVVETLTSVLAQRDALSADVVPELRTSLLDALQSRRQTSLSSESVALGPEELAGLVPEEFRRFIGDEGGRYVLELTVEAAADGGLKVTVVPTIIATVRGGEGPLGGRPLPSNGTLERAILDSLSRRLGG